MIIDFRGINVIFAITIWLIIIANMKKKDKDFPYMFFFTIFYVYLCFVIKYTQFPIIINDEMKREIGQNVFRDANLIPFKGSFNAIRTSLLNIVMTIPFGFGLPFIKEVNLKKIAIYGVLLGISLESLQLIIALIVGFTLRYVDINDVIFNFTGTILGYMLFLGFMSVFKHVVDKYDVEISGLVGYIYYLNN